MVDETDSATLTVKFPPAPRSGDVVFKAVDMTAGYPGKVVFTGTNIEIARGEKVAFLGRNGEGKTTLMRIIMKELLPVEGEAKVGYNVSVGYYAQNQEDILDPQETVFGTLDRIAVGDVRTKIRDILAQFLFRGEDIDKKVAVLSGGERARLGMAKLMLQPYNLLALDEPTNHMDIKSKEILKQALAAYDGTLVVVSHDRDFLDGLVQKIYEFHGGRVKEHLGGVADFLEKMKLENLHELERKFSPDEEKPVPSAKAKAAPKVDSPAPVKDSKADFERRKTASKEEKRLRQRIAYLEKEISKGEERMKKIGEILSNPGGGDDVMELTREYLELTRSTESMTQEWGGLLEEVGEA